MREDDIERLVRLRRVPQSVITRVPGEETEPEPRNGERVVFGAHLDRGLGLPASPFFRQFLDHFGLQPHHLPANACVLLSCFVAFMEAYAGLWPDIDFWSRLFFLKAQTNDGRLRACGAASIYTRPGTPFPKIPTVDSVKNWQMSFFYVRNEGELVDRINLPEFNPAPPVGRINWSHNARSTDQNAEVNLLWDFLATATDGGLTAEDLLCTIAERRVLPLQMRTHKIGHMSGRFDPNRTSKAPLTKAQVASRVNHITKANLAEDWSYGLVPCDRNHPPARVSFVSLPFSGLRLRGRLPFSSADFRLVICLCFLCLSSFLSARTPRTATWRRGGGRRITSIRLTKPATMPATTTCRRRLI
jgi:hypothetical protein